MNDVQELKEAICEIGDRIYKRGFAAANDGNITVRLSENEVLCTPTMHCKGFLKPEDICLVDMDGKQLGRQKKRVERGAVAPGDHEGPAGREERRALPSAARDGVRDRPRADPAGRAAGGRGVSRRGADREVRNARRQEVRRDDPAVRAARRTSSSWPITAR